MVEVVATRAIVGIIQGIISATDTSSKRYAQLQDRFYAAKQNPSKWLRLSVLYKDFENLLPAIKSDIEKTTTEKDLLSESKKRILHNHVLDIETNVTLANKSLSELEKRLSETDNLNKTKNISEEICRCDRKKTKNLFHGKGMKKSGEATVWAHRDEKTLEKLEERLNAAKERLKDIENLLKEKDSSDPVELSTEVLKSKYSEKETIPCGCRGFFEKTEEYENESEYSHRRHRSRKSSYHRSSRNGEKEVITVTTSIDHKR